jgi:endoribonuclease Dicer
MSMDLYVARAMITKASLAFKGSLDITENQVRLNNNLYFS